MGMNGKKRFKAIVVYGDEDLHNPEGVAKAEAAKYLRMKGVPTEVSKINIREMIYSALYDIYIAVVEIPEGKAAA